MNTDDQDKLTRADYMQRAFAADKRITQLERDKARLVRMIGEMNVQLDELRDKDGQCPRG